MKPTSLSNFCVLKSFVDNKKNVLDSILPFVEYAISLLDREWMDFDEIKTLIRAECYLDIPTNTLRTLLKTLKAKNVITDYDDWKKIRFVANHALSAATYHERIQDVNRDREPAKYPCPRNDSLFIR